jgi:hypothetical protein
MRATPFIGMMCAVILASCAEGPPQKPAAPQPKQRNTDIHGCSASEGTAWCDRLFECANVRELAIQKGFFPSREGFNAWCSSHAPGVER